MARSTDQEALDSLADRLAAEPDIELAIVFGSTAGEAAGPDSDLDLAVCAGQPLDAGRREQLIRLAADLTGRPVDLVDLRDAGVVVLRSALFHGRVLFCRNRRTREQLLARLLADTEDFLPYRQRMLEQRRHAWIP